MPIQFNWYIEPNASLVKMTGNVTADEIEALMSRVSDLLQTGSEPCNTIMDMTEKPRIGVNVLKTQSVLRVCFHKNFGWLVVVGASPLVGFWLEMLHRTTRVRFKVFTTVQDAKEFIDGMLKVEKARAEATRTP